MYRTNKDKLILESYLKVINEELDLTMDIKEYLKKVGQSIKSMSNVKKSLQGLMAIVNVANLANKGINAFSGDGVEAGGGGGKDLGTDDIDGNTNHLIDDYEKAMTAGKTPSTDAINAYAKMKVSNDYGIDTIGVKNIEVTTNGHVPVKAIIDGKEYDLTKHLDKWEADKINGARDMAKSMGNETGGHVEANPEGVEGGETAPKGDHKVDTDKLGSSPNRNG